MSHWVTINGNHVLLDDNGRSLAKEEAGLNVQSFTQQEFENTLSETHNDGEEEKIYPFFIEGTEVRVARRGKKIVGIGIQLTGDKPNFDTPFFIVPAHTFVAFKTSPDGIEMGTNKPLIGKYGISISHIVFNSNGTVKDFDAKGTLPSLFKDQVKKELEKRFQKWVLKVPDFLEKADNLMK